MYRKILPVGLDSFEKICQNGYYYIDKTLLIKKILTNRGDVNLFTRPRRFGKTLNMSMLKSFFEIGSDKTLFDGLAISRETQLCEEYQGRHPVVFLSLKGVEGLTFDDAISMLRMLVSIESNRLDFLFQSPRVSDKDKQRMTLLLQEESSETELKSALVTLMRMLHAHYGKQVILLIDEYDVPLDKANNNGYYEQMVSFLRGFFGEAFKTNPDLYFAVLTGCLRISKESIFTGINNLKVDTIMNKRYDEYFGFTDEDVRKLLEDYDLSYAYDDMKAWYDGYRFGDADVYCPWDVVCHCDRLLEDPQARPRPYWNNTSSNQLVQDFIGIADVTTRREIEQLIAGEAVQKKIVEALTYGELTESIDNLWSVLFLTGYLTVDCSSPSTYDGRMNLVIPNREVREIFIEKIWKWFNRKFVQDEKPMQAFCQAFLDGDAEAIQKRLNVILSRMISIMDTKSRDEQKENFYHGLLLGLLRSRQDWLIRSNIESGDGFSDIVIEPEDPDAGIIIEVKYARSIPALEKACAQAMAQIRKRRYDERLRNDGREEIGAYGIAFCKKQCRVLFEKIYCAAKNI